MWLRTVNGAHDCEDTGCAAGGRFPGDVCILLLKGPDWKRRVSLREGGANYSLQRSVLNIRGFQCSDKTSVSACQICIQGNRDETSRVQKI